MIDWDIPKELLGDSRYGIKEYHDPELVTTSKHSSATAGFAEILDEWKTHYFGVQNKEAKEWRGTATALMRAIITYDPGMEQIMHGYNHAAVQRKLTTLTASGYNLKIAEGEGDTRIWIIYA